MKLTRATLAFLILLLAGLACGLPAGGNGNESQAAETPGNDEQAQNPIDAVTDVPIEVPSGEPFLDVPGIGQVILKTDVQGVGEMPLLAWESVAGAERYQLVVFDEAGEPYWAWEGTQAQVYMGGSESQPDADSSGPVIAAGYAWAVVAYDAGGQILASSELRSISP